VLIIKEVKVVCFAALLQVLILKNLHLARILPSVVFCVSAENKELRLREQPPEIKNASKDAGVSGSKANYYLRLTI
jgi:hypothetical protein